MLGIVIVSYRSDDLTVRFVEDQLSRITIPYQVVVVDNGATAEEVWYDHTPPFSSVYGFA